MLNSSFPPVLMQGQPVLATSHRGLPGARPAGVGTVDSCQCVHRVFSVHTQRVCQRVRETASERRQE